MRGSKAKAIRRKVYGDNSKRNERLYMRVGRTVMLPPMSLRAEYKRQKRRLS